jgi:hypothetical protein
MQVSEETTNVAREEVPLEGWLSGRDPCLENADPRWLNDNLNAVVRCFGIKWLESPGENPIQVLWKRRDGFSTAELLTLGNAIEKLVHIDSAWVTNRVRTIKGRKRHDRIGDVFELVGLGMLCTNGQIVTPAKEQQPGFDGTVQLPNGVKLYLSMKNHDISRHEENFQTWSDRITRKFKAAIEAQRLNGQGLIAFAREFPQESDWQRLANSIPELLDRQLRFGRSQFDSDGFWNARLVNVPFSDQLVSFPISYQAMIVSPFHKNERQNLLSQLESATANFHRHANSYGGSETSRCLFLRVSATASVASCQKWCQEYFAETAPTSIDVILLYQVSILMEQSQAQTAIVHQFAAVYRPGTAPFTSADGLTFQPQMQVLVGRFSTSDSRILLAGTSVEISDSYLFQQGDIYCKPQNLVGENLYGEMKHIADGIRTHLVVQNGDGTFTLSANFPPSLRILLYS